MGESPARELALMLARDILFSSSAEVSRAAALLREHELAEASQVGGGNTGMLGNRRDSDESSTGALRLMTSLMAALSTPKVREVTQAVIARWTGCSETPGFPRDGARFSKRGKGAKVPDSCQGQCVFCGTPRIARMNGSERKESGASPGLGYRSGVKVAKVGPGRGRGLVASQAVQAGTVILSDRAFATAAIAGWHSSEELMDNTSRLHLGACPLLECSVLSCGINPTLNPSKVNNSKAAKPLLWSDVTLPEELLALRAAAAAAPNLFFGMGPLNDYGAPESPPAATESSGTFWALAHHAGASHVAATDGSEGSLPDAEIVTLMVLTALLISWAEVPLDGCEEVNATAADAAPTKESTTAAPTKSASLSAEKSACRALAVFRALLRIPSNAIAATHTAVETAAAPTSSPNQRNNASLDASHPAIRRRHAVSTDTLTCERVCLGVFPRAAMLNHACTPNAVFRFTYPLPPPKGSHDNGNRSFSNSFDRKDGAANSYHEAGSGVLLEVVATRRVLPGEEFTVSYGALKASMPSLQTRQKALVERFRFICSCASCATQAAEEQEVSEAISTRTGNKSCEKSGNRTQEWVLTELRCPACRWNMERKKPKSYNMSAGCNLEKGLEIAECVVVHKSEAPHKPRHSSTGYVARCRKCGLGGLQGVKAIPEYPFASKGIKPPSRSAPSDQELPIGELLKAFAIDKRNFDAAVDELWGSHCGNFASSHSNGPSTKAAIGTSAKAGNSLLACLAWRRQHLVEASNALNTAEDACARWFAEQGHFTAAVHYTRRAIAGLEARFAAAATVERASALSNAKEVSCKSRPGGPERCPSAEVFDIDAAACSSELGHEYFKLAELCNLAGDNHSCADAAARAKYMLTVCLGPAAALPLLKDLENMLRKS